MYIRHCRFDPFDQARRNKFPCVSTECILFHLIQLDCRMVGSRPLDRSIRTNKFLIHLMDSDCQYMYKQAQDDQQTDETSNSQTLSSTLLLFIVHWATSRYGYGSAQCSGYRRRDTCRSSRVNLNAAGSLSRGRIRRCHYCASLNAFSLAIGYIDRNS
jgi:hypothetical protein